MNTSKCVSWMRHVNKCSCVQHFYGISNMLTHSTNTAKVLLWVCQECELSMCVCTWAHMSLRVSSFSSFLWFCKPIYMTENPIIVKKFRQSPTFSNFLWKSLYDREGTSKIGSGKVWHWQSPVHKNGFFYTEVVWNNLGTYRGRAKIYRGCGARDSRLLPWKPVRKFWDSRENL